MRIMCGYDNKHIIDGKLYENIIYSEDRQESDAEVLERATGYKFVELVSQGLTLWIKLMTPEGKLIARRNQTHILDQKWNLVFDL